MIKQLITAARWLGPESVLELRGHRLMIDKTVFYCDILFLSGLLKTVWYKRPFFCASLNLHGGQTMIWDLNCQRCMRGIKTEQIICVKPNLGERWIAALYRCKCEPLTGKTGGSRREMCCTIRSQTNSSEERLQAVLIQESRSILSYCYTVRTSCWSCWQSNKLGYSQQLRGQLSPSSWTELLMECRENGRKLGGLVVTGRDSFCPPDERTMYCILGIKMYLYLRNCCFFMCCVSMSLFLCALWI